MGGGRRNNGQEARSGLATRIVALLPLRRGIIRQGELRYIQETETVQFRIGNGSTAQTQVAAVLELAANYSLAKRVLASEFSYRLPCVLSSEGGPCLYAAAS